MPCAKVLALWGMMRLVNTLVSNCPLSSNSADPQFKAGKHLEFGGRITKSGSRERV
jgi:hypothetical protein